jgi:hypothetical protein
MTALLLANHSGVGMNPLALLNLSKYLIKLILKDIGLAIIQLEPSCVFRGVDIGQEKILIAEYGFMGAAAGFY